MATKWIAAVDVLDDTDVGYDGKSLSGSGVVSWKTDEDKSCWGLEDDSEDIPELSTTMVYCFYWLRFKISADLSAGTTLNHIGYLFNSDNELYNYYPDLNNQQFRDCFVPTLPPDTKLDWKDQSLAAAGNVCNYLRGKIIILSPAQ